MAKFWNKRRFLLFLPIFAAIFAIILVNVNDQSRNDERRARDYRPSAEIASITEDLRLADKGKTIFYATQPQLQSVESFSQNCESEGGASTFGCYYNDGKNDYIYLYDLGGFERFDENGLIYDFATARRVTALHELLHAIYSRLDSTKKRLICDNLRESVKNSTDLTKSLSKYPDSQYCTEAFARVGSENIELANDELRFIYREYFDINPTLYRSNQANANNLKQYLAAIDGYARKLDAKKDYIAATKDYRLANAAISEYNAILEKYNATTNTYNEIVSILDSSKSLASL